VSLTKKNFESESDVFAELMHEYHRRKIDEELMDIVVAVARETATPPPQVFEWDWDMFRAVLDAVVRLKEEEQKALRKRR